MPRPVFIPLFFIVATAAVYFAWLAEASVPFFPTALRNEVVRCQPAGPGNSGYVISVLDEYEADWFAGELRGLRETPLYPAVAEGPDTVRFTWIRSFHAPVTVRADAFANGVVRLSARRLPGPDGCELTGDTCVVTRKLSPDEVRRLSALRRAAEQSPAQICRGGADGARWLIEWSGAGEYRFAQRFSPEDGDPLKDLGIAMLDLSGWEFSEVY